MIAPESHDSGLVIRLFRGCCHGQIFCVAITVNHPKREARFPVGPKLKDDVAWDSWGDSEKEACVDPTHE